MSALASWLYRWQPIAVHGAILAGAKPEDVAEALGDSIEATFERWRKWAERQRDYIVSDRPTMTKEEFDFVTHRFIAGD